MRLLTVILIFTGVMLQAQHISHQEVRKMYFGGWDGACGATTLSEKLEDHPVNNDMVLMAYKGAAMTTLANCKKSPFSKLSVFNKGKDLLETAVATAPENLEVRFLRFSVQTNIPGILNYNDIESDKQFIIEKLTLQDNAVDNDLKNRITHYMFEHGDLSETEQKEIKLIMAEN